MEASRPGGQYLQVCRPVRRHLLRGRLLAAHHCPIQILPRRDLRDLERKQGEAGREQGRKLPPSAIHRQGRRFIEKQVVASEDGDDDILSHLCKSPVSLGEGGAVNTWFFTVLSRETMDNHGGMRTRWEKGQPGVHRKTGQPDLNGDKHMCQ